jgi:hypothetical protein
MSDAPQKAHRAKTAGAKANKHKKNAEKNNPKACLLSCFFFFTFTLDL